MLLSFLTIGLVGLASTADAFCIPRIRREWRTLSKSEKKAYIDAVQCLWDKPAKVQTRFPGIKNRHDDFVFMHLNATENIVLDPVLGPQTPGGGIHLNGVFLPWHRYMLWEYENALVNECGYNGAQPYWDWSRDTPEFGGDFATSPIFDPVTGFGGNGAGGTVPITDLQAALFGPPVGNCINDGPFASRTLWLGPSYTFNQTARCMKRNIQGAFGNTAQSWSANVVPCLQKQTYAEFAAAVDTDTGATGNFLGIHGGGHYGTGGEMLNLWSSINDPIFYLHHANLDRIWWSWQLLGSGRLTEIGGPRYGNGSGTVTLDTQLWMGYNAQDRPIRQVMDPLNLNGQGILCYVYL
ncbi:Di-copper centre-containing protein [Trichodelitschia bisporula]|uniref:Di-copper centre-containing protein n=1 Tax=Trichodelitschia bisporula TaxID=703511 RepID=A0A6G1HXT1_9PEZI|nr:Di-copper centre-containing protein [Trichodelitschia bisporula]